MGRRFNKKTATTFDVVHRAHDDVLFDDEDASQHVLVPKVTKHNSRPKTYTTADLEKKIDTSAVRANEGMAAQYGVFFDDSKYDYMQHLKPIGNKDAVFIAKEEEPKERKINFEELLAGQLPSKETRKVARDAYESIPEELKGLQPDLDPRIREVLEALEDEAYIEEEEEDEKDIFQQILQSGEADDEEFEYGDLADQDYEDEWDMDNYADEMGKYDEMDEMDKYDEKHEKNDDHISARDLPYNDGEAPEEVGALPVSTGWEKDFLRFKQETKNKTNSWDSDDDFDEVSELPELPNIAKKSNTKTRKKKGAMTDTSSFSMSSSANFRTEGLTLLDDRYEQMAKRFEEEDEEKYEQFDMDKERTDFEGMLDDFLENFELEGGGRRLVKKDPELHKIRDAADKASNTKLSRRRMKEGEKKSSV